MNISINQVGRLSTGLCLLASISTVHAQSLNPRTATAVSTLFADWAATGPLNRNIASITDCKNEFDRGVGLSDRGSTYPSDRLRSLQRADFCLDQIEGATLELQRTRAIERQRQRAVLRSGRTIVGTSLADLDAQEAQDASDLATFRFNIATARRATKSSLRVEANNKDFLALNWGVGVGFSSTTDITSAIVDSAGIVRVSEKTSQKPRVMLEMHYYGFCKSQRCMDGKFGVGPFTGIAATNNTLTSIAIGVMFGWRKEVPEIEGFENSVSNSDAFSVGVGVVLDTNVRRLGGGFVEGEAAPTGVAVGTNAPLEGRSRWSPLLFFSYTF